MDKLNQPNQSSQQGTIGEKQYNNKPLQQPIKPVRPGQNRTPNQNNNRTNVQTQPRQQGTGQQQRVVQQQQRVVQQQRVNQHIQQVNNQQQQRNNQQQHVVQPIQQGYNGQQRVNNQNHVSNNIERLTQDDNSSLAGRPKLTRLQKEAQGIPNRNTIIEQTSGTIPFQQQRDYNLSNTNAASFKVKQVKKEGIGFLILPLSLIHI